MSREVPENMISERAATDGPLSILVVEDEALIRMVTVDTLETLGFAVHEAGSAADAVGKLRSAQRIDAALIDMGLPDRKGDVLVGELRALQPTLKVIIASGYSAANIKKRVAEDPITKVLAKPFDGRQLEAALKSLGLDAPTPQRRHPSEPPLGHRPGAPLRGEPSRAGTHADRHPDFRRRQRNRLVRRRKDTDAASRTRLAGPDHRASRSGRFRQRRWRRGGAGLRTRSSGAAAGDGVMTPLEKLASLKMPFSETLGLVFTEASLDRVVARMQVRDSLCNGRGILHGGAAMALADTIGAAGTIVNLPPDAKGTTTIESKTNFVAPAMLGTEVIATATPVHRGRRTQVWQTRIETTDGKLVALVTQTQMVL